MLFNSIKKVENEFLKMMVENVYNFNIDLIEYVKIEKDLKKEISNKKDYINKMNNKRKNNDITRKENIEYNEVLEVKDFMDIKNNFYDVKIELEKNKTLIINNIEIMNKYIEKHDIKKDDMKIIYNIIEYLKSDKIENDIKYIV